MNARTLKVIAATAFILTLALCPPAHAWNAKGHMVIARMTW